MVINVQQITNGKWKENCYVINNERRGAVIIDPGGDAERIIGHIENKELRVFAILNTHAHYDHIGAVTDLKTKFSVPFYLHSEDLNLLRYANLYRRVFDGYGPVSPASVDYYIDQLDTPLCIGDFSVHVLFTPGHTQGSVCFMIEDHLFTGDTLLRGRIGRVDLPGGNKSALCNSLKKLCLLPSGMKLYPGHGRTSTMQEELEKNHELLEAIACG